MLIEIDEDSHRTYECAKERSREAVFVANSAIGSTIVMIRFNPDAYTDYDGKRHPSCFKFNQSSGTVVVNASQRKQWKERCEALIATVTNFLDPKTEVPPPEPDRVLFSAELFYDDVKGASTVDIERARARVRSLGKKRARDTAAASSAASASSSTQAVNDSDSE